VSYKDLYRRALVGWGVWRERLVFAVLRLMLPKKYRLEFLGKGAGSSERLEDRGSEDPHRGDIGVFYQDHLVCEVEVTGSSFIQEADVLAGESFRILVDKVKYALSLRDRRRWLCVHICDRAIGDLGWFSWISGDRLYFLLTEPSVRDFTYYGPKEKYLCIDPIAWNRDVRSLIDYIERLAAVG